MHNSLKISHICLEIGKVLQGLDLKNFRNLEVLCFKESSDFYLFDFCVVTAAWDFEGESLDFFFRVKFDYLEKVIIV